MQQPNLVDSALEKEETQNLDSNLASAEPGIEGETSGGELHENKEDLQKIIERNRQQIEKLDGDFEVEKQQEAMEKIAEQFNQEKPETAKSTTAPAKDDDQDEEETAHVQSHAEAAYQINDPERQIEHIVQLAITKDPYFAVKVARHLDDNYILNEIHDRLVEDQVRDELIKRGLLKES